MWSGILLVSLFYLAGTREGDGDDLLYTAHYSRTTRSSRGTGVGEAYKRAALSVKSDVRFIRLLPQERLPEVMAAITTMDAEVAFRFLSIDLNYNKVIGVLVSMVVGVLFVNIFYSEIIND